jgi:hypothetical protein
VPSLRWDEATLIGPTVAESGPPVTVRFDSGNLGYGPEGRPAATQRITWKTPKGLKPGTYTYFCRVHPFMRGAFRVANKR